LPMCGTLPLKYEDAKCMYAKDGRVSVCNRRPRVEHTAEIHNNHVDDELGYLHHREIFFPLGGQLS
jgi:hypothetical protein